ncbi:MAG: ferrous iron transporter B [Thermoplasmata archaeon]|nr:ferrous iron transporter B [Thermoplasmata archaeon]
MKAVNVGKSVVFSRLTGAKVITSNYAGTTVDFCQGHIRVGKGKFDIIDAPGTYSLQPTNKSEEVAVEMLKQADIVVIVLDSTNLERNLFLTHEILETGKPAIIALNMWDEAQHLGIDIDQDMLEGALGVPVVPTVALSGEGIKDLVDKFDDARTSELEPTIDEARWINVGTIIKNVQTVTHKHHTMRDRLEDVTIRPLTGIPIAIGIIFLAFWLVRFIGEGLITFVMDPLFELYRPAVMDLSNMLGGSGWLHDMLIGSLINGDVDFLESLGVLTTGLYVPFGMVLPYIVAFYLVLALMEDTGYLPRLSTLSDNIFHRLGMHGYGIVPLMLGMGCNVPGVLATRNLETQKQRFIAATLLAVSVPCMAQIAMIFGVLGSHGPFYIFLVFITLFFVYITIGLILNRIMKGESPEIFLEIPPYRRPVLRTTLKKTWMRVQGFLKEAVPWMIFGVFFINILYTLGFFDLLGQAFSPLMESWLGLPAVVAPVLIIGFLRKDLAVGMLLSLGTLMSPMQLVIAVTMLTMYFPCMATFIVLFKELGLKGLVQAIMVMFIMAATVGGLMRLILIGV